MMKKISISVIAIAMILAVLYCWPYSRYDLSKIHPKLRGLNQPYQSITADVYLDGGSLSVEIIDRDGQVLQVALPVVAGTGSSQVYPRFFIGALNATSTNAIEAGFPEDNKRYLAGILSENNVAHDKETVLLALRGSPRDYADIYSRLLWRKITGKSF